MVIEQCWWKNVDGGGNGYMSNCRQEFAGVEIREKIVDGFSRFRTHDAVLYCS